MGGGGSLKEPAMASYRHRSLQEAMTLGWGEGVQYFAAGGDGAKIALAFQITPINLQFPVWMWAITPRYSISSSPENELFSLFRLFVCLVIVLFGGMSPHSELIIVTRLKSKVWKGRSAAVQVKSTMRTRRSEGHMVRV